ncbi:MAG: tetratricopeptide repeat protein [PVC group bacterium]|nr:tetratricopeptide repeat protein [PVC group bacterium]
MKRKTLTILFADVQGYTLRTGRQTRSQNEIFVKEIRSFVEKHAREKGGTFVKAMGDGFLLTFESPTDAVACGQQMQKQIEQRNANILSQDNFIRFRIGISTGEVTVDDHEDVYGDAVNIAARIQSFAGPNDVYISETTYLAMNKSEINAMDLGPQRFKNVVQEVRVYKVMDHLQKTIQQTLTKKPAKKSRFITIFIIANLILMLLFFAKDKILKVIKEFDAEKIRIETFLQTGDYESAIRLAEAKLEESPENIGICLLASEASLNLKDYEQAEKYINRALELDPENYDLYNQLADIQEQAGKRNEAIQTLGEYITKEPDKHLRKIALQKLKDLEATPEATPIKSPQRKYRPKKDTSEKEQPKPQDNEPPILEQLNEIKQLIRDSNFDQAVEQIDELLAEYPNNLKLLTLASDAFFRIRDYAQAATHMRRAIDINPRRPILYYKMAMIHEQAGQTEEAIQMLREYINREPRERQRQKALRDLKMLEKKR